MTAVKLFAPNEHRTMHFKTTGKIVYDPVRAGKVAKDSGWCVIDVDTEEMAHYYRHQFYKKFGIELDSPSWMPHLSVLIGTGTFDDSIPWRWRDGEVVDVEYSHYLFWNKNHVWVNSHCDALVEIRKHYNSSSEVKDRGHITVGRIPDKKVGVIPVFSSFKDFTHWEDFKFNSPLI